MKDPLNEAFQFIQDAFIQITPRDFQLVCDEYCLEQQQKEQLYQMLLDGFWINEDDKTKWLQ